MREGKVFAMVRPLDAPSDLPVSPSTVTPVEAPYVYAATDLRPRQTREIELCAKASEFDWQYTGAWALALAGSIYVNIDRLKHTGEPGVRLIGPALVGLTTGGFLSGGYLSLPKCDPLWAGGPPPEGNVRADWPLAVAIATISGVMGPIMDYSFLGPVKLDWSVTERTLRVVVAATTGVVGALVPYVLPPKTWRARKEIDRLRVEGSPQGAKLSYTLAF
jgi:hypothetical protein